MTGLIGVLESSYKSTPISKEGSTTLSIWTKDGPASGSELESVRL